MDDSTAQVGFIGLGKMGAPMALNLLRAGVPLIVWNRTRAKTAPHAEAGAVIADTPAGAAAPIVITMVIDLPDVIDVVEGEHGLLAGWRAAGIESPILVIMGAVSALRGAEYAERMLADHGVRVIDAPVSGGDIGAINGTLSIFVGGDPEAAAQVHSLFEIMGARVAHLGAAGAGQVAKICNQVIVAATVNAVAEAFVLARRSGLDVAALLHLLQGGLADSEILRQKGWRLVERDYRGGGALANQVKDLRSALEVGRSLGLPLLGAAANEQFFQQLVALGLGEEDHTAAQRIHELLGGDATAIVPSPEG